MRDLSHIDATERARGFPVVEALALSGPLLIVRAPLPPRILISAREDARLERRDRQARAVEDGLDVSSGAAARSSN